MANNHIPKIPQFNPSEIALEKYIVLLEANFSTYEVTDENKKKNFLIVSLGTKIFDTLCNLTAPELPSDKTYDDLVTLLKDHFTSRPSYHRSLCLFQQRRKSSTETLKEVYVDLKNLANNCKFGNSYDGRLRDQLFIAVDNQPYFKYLMSEDLKLENMSSKELLERLLTLEKAHMGEQTENKINLQKNYVKKEVKREECKHCGYPHNSYNCKFKGLSCNQCGKTGHLQRVCRNKKENFKKNTFDKQKFKKNKVKQIESTVSDDDEQLLKISSTDDKINKVKQLIKIF